MLYLDPNSLPGMGNSKQWRIFSDTKGELETAIRAVNGTPKIAAKGTPGEHAVVSTSIKNKLKTTEADMRTLVKLIKGKAGAKDEPEASITEDVLNYPKGLEPKPYDPDAPGHGSTSQYGDEASGD